MLGSMYLKISWARKIKPTAKRVKNVTAMVDE
jgi:hypothetical protein